jgi:hypothetical protein
MRGSGRRRRCAAALLALALLPCGAAAQASGAAPSPATSAAPRDGSRDFDFEIGRWKTRVSRLVKPLTGSTTWVELEGTSVVQRLLGGAANLVELDVSGPSGRIRGLSLRLYQPESRQWSIRFASAADGELGLPTVGEFKDGRGEFYNQETFAGRAVLVRNVWSEISADRCRFEQAFSTDGGRTWEVNWIAVDTRIDDGRG